MIISTLAEITKHATGRDLDRGTSLDPLLRSADRTVEIPIPLGMSHDRLHVAFEEHFNLAHRIDKQLVGQLEQQVASGVGKRANLSAVEQLFEAFVDTNITTRQ